VSAFAGDRQLTETEKPLFDNLKQSRGGQFFSDLLYAITHQYFLPEVAENLWKQILQHKHKMSNVMKRNIRITVASLDYLSNLTTNLHSATVIGEAQIAGIIRLSFCDGLTGLFNHAYCYQKIDMELRRYARYGTVTSFMMIDIDNFKKLNDQYGHPEGDKFLAVLGTFIERTVRDSDICCRYGGEEFAVIMPSTDIRQASVLAKRLRAKLAQRLINGQKMTVSIGVASCGENTGTSQALVKKADAALYQAKRSGKNRVVAST
jgi:two-component system, cell cycle response regulator